MDQFSINFIDLPIDCEQMIQIYDQDLELTVQGDQNWEARRVWRKPIEMASTLYQTLLDANERFYGFELNQVIECYFARYEQGCHYNALHWDCLPNEPHQRKLSFSLELNEDFEGGELITHNGTIDTKPGRLIVFPSYLLHGVTSVTRGRRYAIYGFLSGPIWR